jgi:glycosyltransferase involved in cell wall biosynthesis
LKHRLVYAVTHGVSANIILRGQLKFMREIGFDVTVIASPGPDLEAVAEREGVRAIGVSMSRSVRLSEGPRAAIELTSALRALRPHILNASTPKAALLSLVAATALGVPHRVYGLWGLRLEGFEGPARALLAAAEHATSACAHRVVSVSQSLKQTYADLGCAPLKKISVIPPNGIDVARFVERVRSRDAAKEVRQRLAIPNDAIVAGFVGRLATDKGVADMLEAVERASTEVPNLRLLLVGGDLAGDTLPRSIADRLAESRHVIQAGKVDHPSAYYAAMDLLLFPSYREGLPTVPLEAAACELPAIGYRSTGVVDAIVDGETGVIVERKDVGALTRELVRYAKSHALRAEQGEKARRRIVAELTNDHIWARWARFYESLLR